MEIKTTILLVNKMSLSTLKSYKMKITKKILFPTDFSIVAENAFIYALSLGEQIKAEIRIVHF